MTKDINSLSDGQPRRIRATRYIEQLGAEGVFDLAALKINVRQGDSFDEIPVYAAISCGQPSLPFDDEYLQLNTWQVLMRIHLQNARIVYGSIRKHVLQAGSFESMEEGSMELQTIEQQQRRLGYGLDVKASRKSAGFGAFFAGGGTKAVQRTQKSTHENKTKAVAEIRLFGDFGHDTIGFGDKDYGDVRLKYGFLAYEYPFDDYDTPLFRVSPIDPSKPVRMTIYTAVPFDRLHIDMEPRSPVLRKGAEEELKHRGNEAVERLRRQLLVDELKTRIGRNQRGCGVLPKHREGEFVVTIEHIEIEAEPLEPPRA